MNINRDYTITLKSISSGVLQIQKPITFNIADRNTQNIYLLLSEDLEEGTEIYIAIKNPEGKKNQIKGENRNNNIFEFYCPSDVEGDYAAEFHITIGDKIATTFPFYYKVNKSLNKY